MSSKKKELREVIRVLAFLFLIGFVLGTLLFFFGKHIDSTLALQFLSVIAKISASLLGMFTAGFLFLLASLSPTEIRRIMSKADFIASFLLFATAIVHSLVSMLSVERTSFIDLGTPVGFLILFMPFWWMLSAIFILAIFIYFLYVART